MKISAYYKNNGENVDLLTEYQNLESYDKVFISKVFTDTVVPDKIFSLPNVEFGGTGFYFDKAPNLPDEIEHQMPDYHLYNEWIDEQIRKAEEKAILNDEEFNKSSYMTQFKEFTDYSIGFITRGCFRKCSFCVNQKYDRVFTHSPLNEFLDTNRKKICLLDDNFFGCPQWKELLQELIATGKPFKFKQGLDERLLTEEKCKLLFTANYDGDYTFAFDNIKDKDIIIDKLKLIKKYTDKIPKFYVFCGYNHNSSDNHNESFWQQDIIDLFERIKILMKHKCLPYIMRHQDYEKSPYKGTYINIARWCNQPNFFKKKSYREFCLINGEQSACYKRMVEFEKAHPEIAEKYYDLRFGGNLK